jgi:hypothetical protein
MCANGNVPTTSFGELYRQLVALLQNDYSVEEFAAQVKRRPYSVREWCRLGRIRASKSLTGAGPAKRWVIAHAELDRFRREGLLPRHSRR